jgi:hypothetical protein
LSLRRFAALGVLSFFPVSVAEIGRCADRF